MKSFVFVWLVAVVVVCFGDDQFDLKPLLENIPEEERVDFVKYHLQLGYNLTKSGRSIARDLRSKLSMQIYDYMIENHKIVDKDVLDLVREIVCFEDGTCVDLGDVGVHPFL